MIMLKVKYEENMRYEIKSVSLNYEPIRAAQSELSVIS